MGRRSTFRPWSELVPDVLGHILTNLPLQEVLQVIPMVCKSWCQAVEGPYCWQRIDDHEWRLGYELSTKKFDRILRMLIIRSSGSLRELSLSFVDDKKMLFIAEHGGSLQSLELRHGSISDSILGQVGPKLSSLTTLGICYCGSITSRGLESIGRNCQMLVSLTWIKKLLTDWTAMGKLSLEEDARVIARTMPKLKHLTIASYLNINTSDALEILSGCPELETLDVRGCWGITLDVDRVEEKFPKVRLLGPRASYEECSE